MSPGLTRSLMICKPQAGMANKMLLDTEQRACLGSDSLLDFFHEEQLACFASMESHDAVFLKTGTSEKVLKFYLKHFVVIKQCGGVFLSLTKLGS